MTATFNITFNTNYYSYMSQYRIGLGTFNNVSMTPPDNGLGRCLLDIRNKYSAATGTTISFYNAFELAITASGAYPFYGISNQVRQTGDGWTNSLVYGIYNVAGVSGTSVVTTLRGTATSIQALDTSTITTATGQYVSQVIDGTATTFYGTTIKTNGGGGTITNYVGLCIESLDSKSTKISHILIGTTTVPQNRWCIYNISNYNNLMCGPTINCAPTKEDEFLGDMTWSVGAAAAGVKWRLTLAGAGAIAQIANARGGIISITSTIATPSWLDEYANTGWSVQDYPVLYCRFRTLEVANTMKAVGFTDAVNGAGNLPYTTNALLITVDTSIGNFFYLTGVVGGARVDVSTTVALSANYKVFMLIPKYLPATGAFDGYELWVDGVYKCALTAAQCPAAGTMMQALPAYAGNLGGAVMSTIFVDTVKYSQRRNTGTAA